MDFMYHPLPIIIGQKDPVRLITSWLAAWSCDAPLLLIATEHLPFLALPTSLPNDLCPCCWAPALVQLPPNNTVDHCCQQTYLWQQTQMLWFTAPAPSPKLTRKNCFTFLLLERCMIQVLLQLQHMQLVCNTSCWEYPAWLHWSIRWKSMEGAKTR